MDDGKDEYDMFINYQSDEELKSELQNIKSKLQSGVQPECVLDLDKMSTRSNLICPLGNQPHKGDKSTLARTGVDSSEAQTQEIANGTDLIRAEGTCILKTSTY